MSLPLAAAAAILSLLVAIFFNYPSDCCVIGFFGTPGRNLGNSRHGLLLIPSIAFQYALPEAWLFPFAAMVGCPASFRINSCMARPALIGPGVGSELGWCCWL